MPPNDESQNTPHVVVVGGGFGGLQAVRELRGAPVRVTLVDRQNFHLFQPLAYQVATGALSAVEIATPLRQILRRQKNASVLLAEVTGFDLERRVVRLDELPNGEGGTDLPYDMLVVAGGSAYSYFGHDEWAPYAPELKSLEGALDLRARLLTAFEAAEVETDAERRRAWLTFVVVGAGPTGVEMAGQIAEIARDTLRRDFRAIDTRAARVLLIEAGDRVLATFPEGLSAPRRALARAAWRDAGAADDGRRGRRQGRRGADGRRLTRDDRVTLGRLGGGRRSLATRGSTRRRNRRRDRPGRTHRRRARPLAARATPRCSRPATWSSFAPPTAARRRFPGSRPSRCSRAGTSRATIRTGERRPFRYVDKGNLATIGRSHAVADIKGVQLSGFPAWLTWLVVHLALPDRLPEPAARATPLDVQLRHTGRERARHPRLSAAAHDPDRLGVGQSSEAPAPGDPRDA